MWHQSPPGDTSHSDDEKTMKDFVKHDPDLPALSPMYTCLWTLIAPTVEYPFHDSDVRCGRKVTVLTSRMALYRSLSYDFAWVHLCTPKKLYNQLKRHYTFYGPIKGKHPKLPLKAHALIIRVRTIKNAAQTALFINNENINNSSTIEDIKSACALNKVHNVECWRCGALLKTNEKLMIDLNYIGSKV